MESCGRKEAKKRRCERFIISLTAEPAIPRDSDPDIVNWIWCERDDAVSPACCSWLVHVICPDRRIPPEHGRRRAGVGERIRSIAATPMAPWRPHQDEASQSAQVAAHATAAGPGVPCREPALSGGGAGSSVGLGVESECRGSQRKVDLLRRCATLSPHALSVTPAALP